MHGFGSDAWLGKDLGYYFSDWIWEQSSINFMKSMLLFFDGIALALPFDLAEQMVDRDPILATPLAERGLLVNFVPAATLDAESADRLAFALTEAIKFYPFREGRGPRLEDTTLGSFHWGWGRAATVTVDALESALAERGLITPRTESELYDMDAEARFLVLTLFAQALRAQLSRQGIDLHLTTDSWEIRNGAVSPLYHYFHDSDQRGYGPSGRPTFSAGFADPVDYFIRAKDLADVGANLSSIPLDEVLDFREENGQHYRAYARGLRDLMMLRGQVINNIDLERLLEERSSEIRDQAADLRLISRKAFGVRLATLLVSLAGAAWTLRTGDPIGGLFAGAAAGLQAVPMEGNRVTAYSYLMMARDLGNR